MASPALRSRIKFTSRLEGGRLVVGAELPDTSPRRAKTLKSNAKRPTQRIVFRGEPEVVVPPYDPEKDWYAWRNAVESRGRGFFPPKPGIAPSEDAILALQIATERHFHAADPRLQISAERVMLGAVLTAYFGEVLIAHTEVQPYRADFIIDALNRYPHSASAPCRWLIPALRNLVGGPREEPDEISSRWRDEEERRYRICLHPWSTVFQGSPDKHSLIDYQNGSHPSPLSRTHLERWRLRAHLMVVPTTWKFSQGYCNERRPPLSPGRLNALTTHAANALRADHFERQDVEPTIGELRGYLLRNAADPHVPMDERRRCRDAFVLLNEAAAYNLVQKPTFSLDLYHVREYNKFLSAIKMQWSWSLKFPFARRLEVCRQFLAERGWKDSEEVRRFLDGREPGLCSPREIAGLLVCMREELQLCHPQTFAEALAMARKLFPDIPPGESPPKRRGRPPRPKEFSPVPPSSD